VAASYEEFFARRELKPGQNSSVRVFDLATGQIEEVYATASAIVGTANWTYNDTLVFNANGRIFQVSVAGGQPQLIDFGRTDLNHDHTLSPERDAIYLTTNGCDLLRGSLAGGPPVVVTDNHDGLVARYAHGVSPDGGTLLFTGGNTNGWLAPYHIYALDLASRQVRQLTDSAPFRDDGPEFTPNAEWIYLQSDRAAQLSGHMQIFRMRPDGTDLTQITHDARVNWFPHPSPDGRHLVYLSYEPLVVGHPFHVFVDLVVLELPSHAEVARFEIFGGNGSLSENGWSPDGQKFSFTEYRLCQEQTRHQEGDMAT